MSRFTWRIENFSQLDAEKIDSMTFVVNEHQWRLCLYPKGDGTDHLSLYLSLANTGSLPSGWSITANYHLALINQKNNNKTIKIERKCRKFETGFTSRGYPSLILVGKFHDKSEGYLVGDTCLIEAEVCVLPDACSASTNNALDSHVALYDPNESVYVEAQMFLESLLKKRSNSCMVSKAPTCEMVLLKGHASSVKEILDMLISYPFDALADPRNETAILESLSPLNDHLYLFSDGRAVEIMNLKATFPQIMQNWRNSVQGKERRSEHPWSSFDKTQSLLEELVKTGEDIKAKVKELNKKETELEAKLDVIEHNIRQLKEEREELSHHTKAVCSLAEEQAKNIKAEKVELVGPAIKKLKVNLK